MLNSGELTGWRKGRGALGGTPNGGGIWADEKRKKGKKKLKQVDQERRKERNNNNCLPSLLMSLWFYRLFQYAKGRVLLTV